MVLCRVCRNESEVWPHRPTSTDPRLEDGETCDRCGRDPEQEQGFLLQSGAGT